MWLACVVYSTIPSFWLLIRPRAEYWRLRKRSPYLVLLPVWIAMWIILGLFTSRWRHVALYTAPWTWIPASLLFSSGLWIYSKSGKPFGPGQLGGLPEVLPNHREQRLVTTEIRSRVRHPVYVAHPCEMLAWSMGAGLVACYALTAFGVVTGAIMIRTEDAELEQRYGEEYRRYRRNVPAVLPRVFRRRVASHLPAGKIILEVLANMPPGIATIEAFGEGPGGYVVVTPSDSVQPLFGPSEMVFPTTLTSAQGPSSITSTTTTFARSARPFPLVTSRKKSGRLRMVTSQEPGDSCVRRMDK